MDTEFARFRINPALRDQAMQVCARLGVELSDVLRAVVTRIAHDGAIPFAMPAAESPTAPASPPSTDERLWASMRSQVEAEVALALLARFIADCSTTIDEQVTNDRERTARLSEQRDEARRLRRELDVTDADAVRTVLQKYGPLVRSSVN
jgi:addiction module RelB/DinJ family antitoxin